MALDLVIFIAWIVIVVFAIAPKRIALVDIVFLYFITVILITSTFTFLDVNLHAVTVSRSVGKSFAAIISRMIPIPLLLIISVNALRSSLQVKYKWWIGCAVLLVLTAYDWLLKWSDVIMYRNWNVLYVFVMYSLFMAVINLIAWWFVNLGRKEAQ